MFPAIASLSLRPQCFVLVLACSPCAWKCTVACEMLEKHEKYTELDWTSDVSMELSIHKTEQPTLCTSCSSPADAYNPRLDALIFFNGQRAREQQHPDHAGREERAQTGETSL